MFMQPKRSTLRCWGRLVDQTVRMTGCRHRFWARGIPSSGSMATVEAESAVSVARGTDAVDAVQDVALPDVEALRWRGRACVRLPSPLLRRLVWRRLPSWQIDGDYSRSAIAAGISFSSSETIAAAF